jgi:hypothetical protein
MYKGHSPNKNLQKGYNKATPAKRKSILGGLQSRMAMADNLEGMLDGLGSSSADASGYINKQNSIDNYSNKSGPAKKNSPYKMPGMAFHGQQTPMKTTNGMDANGNPTGGKASPAKEPIMLGIGMAMDVFGNMAERADQKKRDKARAKEIDLSNKINVQDKIAGAVSAMGNRKQSLANMYASKS